MLNEQVLLGMRLEARSWVAAKYLGEASGLREGFPDDCGIVHPPNEIKAERERLVWYAMGKEPSDSEWREFKRRNGQLKIAGVGVDILALQLDKVKAHIDCENSLALERSQVGKDARVLESFRWKGISQH